jgi:hypothetical protein
MATASVADISLHHQSQSRAYGRNRGHIVYRRQIRPGFLRVYLLLLWPFLSKHQLERTSPEPATDEIGTYRYGSPKPSSWDGINAILKPQRLTNATGEPIIEERFHLISLNSGHVDFGGYAVQEGDLVCILKGGSYPYVLRQRRDGLYHLVSDTCEFQTTLRR